MHNIMTLLFVQNICRFWLALMPQLILHNQQQIKCSITKCQGQGISPGFNGNEHPWLLSPETREKTNRKKFLAIQFPAYQYVAHPLATL